MPASRPRRDRGGRNTGTLLVFTLGAARERARRRLLPRRLGAWELALYRDCLETALNAGRANGCRLRVCAPAPLPLGPDAAQFPQEGGGFGSRLRRAVARQRPAPDRPLVLVGSDVPGLRPRHVARALDELARDPGRLVVGPSPDGGFYLLAAAHPIDGLLAEVSWRRADTLASLLRAARARGWRVTLIAPLADLDRAADLARCLARGPAPALPWLASLAALLRRLRRPPAPAALGRPRLCPVPVATGRGPPA